MSQITPPTVLLDALQSVVMRVDYSSQVGLQSPWTGGIQILDRGYPRWIGVASFARIGSERPDFEIETAAIEAFFSSFHGLANWFELPHHRETLASGVSADVSSRTVNSDGDLEHGLDSALTGAMVGTRVRSGNWTFSIREILAGNAYILDPQRPLAVNDTIEALRHDARDGEQHDRAGNVHQPGLRRSVVRELA